jgi:predicted nucleic acid-binding protein
MKILDSNLWVKGTLGTNRTAATLLDEIESGTTTSAMDEYILAEVLAAFDRTLSGEKHDRILTAFLTRLHLIEGLVEFPEWHTQRSARGNTVLEYHRNRAAIGMLARVFDVQAKDAPILVFAYNYYDQYPAVLTNDEPFSGFDPSAYDLSNLSVRYVE